MRSKFDVRNDVVLSVILPVFNGEKYLNEAIDSILSQSYKAYEFIIINDGSTDNSLSIIESYSSVDSRIRVISRENKGLVYTLNEGIFLATGSYIARMDADDVSMPLRFEKQVALLDSGIDICGCHYEEIDEHGNNLRSRIMPLTDKEIFLCLGRTVPFAHGSVMFRKDKFIELGMKYGDTKYSKAEDYALWCDMFTRSFRFSNVDLFLFKYRNLDGTLTSSNQHLSDSACISLKFIKDNEDRIYEFLDDYNHFSEDISIIRNYVVLGLIMVNIKKVAYLLKIEPRFLLKSFKMMLSAIFRSKYRRSS